MIGSVARFELTYQLRNPVLWTSLVLFALLTFASVTIDQVQIGAGGNANINAPYAVILTVAVMGILNLFVLVALVANAILRDDETRFGPILKSSRLKPAPYILGRFIGASLAASIAFAGVPLAHLLGSLAPWLDPEELGPFRLSSYLYAYFAVGVPMIVIFGAMLYAIASLTRSMMGAYIGAVAILIGWTLSGILLDRPELETVAMLTDPTGLSALLNETEYWTAADRNNRLPEFSGDFLMNRAVWTGVAVMCLTLPLLTRSFDAQDRRPKPARRAQRNDSPSISIGAVHAAPARNSRTTGAQLAARTAFDLRYVLLSPAFPILLILGLFNSAGALWLSTEIGGVELLPVTRLMVNTLSGAFSIIPIVIAGYYAGDLVWRDRERRIHELIDSTPTSDWSFVAPKALAIILALSATAVVGMLAGVCVQALKGYSNFELEHYALWYGLPTLILSAQLGILALFLQTLSPNKYVGWGLLLLWFIASTTFVNLGWEHKLYDFGSAPSAPISDFNGRAHFWIGEAWYNVYWTAGSIILSMLSWALWPRGADRRLLPRLKALPRRFSGPSRWALIGALAMFGSVGGWIFYNTTVLNPYVTTLDTEKALAEAEKALAKYETMPGPTIRHVTLDVDLHPRTRTVTTRGSYEISNSTTAPISEMIMAWQDLDEIVEITVPSGRIKTVWEDFDVQLWTFDKPLAPGESLTMSFVTRISNPGFTNDRGQHQIVSNGTFLSNDRLSPYLGLSRSFWLQDRAKRRKYGLEPERRPAPLEDPTASAHHYLRPDSDWVTADITVSTDDDQIPIAPGYLVSETRKDGRITRRFSTEAPIHHFFSIQSARYAIRTAEATTSAGPVTLEIYHHPSHDRNTALMEEAMKVSLRVLSERFSPYQFRQLRILEFPAYATYAQSFANTIPFSEDIGWLQADPAENEFDVVTYVTAHEIAHQWWAHQVIGADQQGATMLSETFSQYSALLVMEELYGPEKIRRFLSRELNTYLSSRGSDVVEEVPLMRVEDQPYIHYNKGSLVMYFLRNEIGEEAVNRAMKRLIERYAFQPAPYPSTLDFIAMLREEAGPQYDNLITDLFERITLYDARATAAKKRRLPDGRWEVALTVDVKKYYADGEGVETEAPFEEEFEIGVFTQKPEDKAFSRSDILLFEKRVVKSGMNTVVLTLPSGTEPTYAGLDPYLKRIDRNGDDNLAEVTEGP
jgi:aminopeptidase N/ABC-type transport system involved in multi-copper enzyme maturation permease subunit